MDKIVVLFEELFAALDGVDSPLLIAELVLTAVLAHRVKVQNAKLASNTNAAEVTPKVVSDPKPVTTPSTSQQVVAVKKDVIKAQMKKRLLEDLDLCFSTKSTDEMSDAELARVQNLLTYMEECDES